MRGRSAIHHPPHPGLFRAAAVTAVALALLGLGLHARLVAASTLQWSSSGPEGGYITSLFAAPDGALLAGVSSADGAGNGGVYRSVDDGVAWTALASGLPTSQPVTAIGRSLDGTLVAGVQAFGVYRSTDGGASWSLAAGQPSSTIVNAFVVAPDGALIAGADNAGPSSIWRSTDSGASWSVCGTGAPAGTSTMDLVRGPDGRLLAAAGNFLSGASCLSTDSGAHWSVIATGLVGSPTCADIAPDGTMWLGASASVFACTDTARGWVLAQDLGYSVEDLGVQADGTLFAATYFGGVFRSTDDGASWAQTNNGLLTYDIRRMAVTPAGHVAVGGLSGVHVSADSGGSWQWRNGGLDWLQGRAVAIAPDGTLFCGTDDAGVFRSGDGGASWTPLAGFPGRPVIECIAATPDGTIVAGTNTGSGARPGGVFRSSDGGETWSSINTGLPYPMVYAVAIEPTGTLYVHPWGNGVYRSDDGGGAWQAIGLGGTFLEALAVSPDGTLVAGASVGVYRNTSGGSTWTGPFSLGARVTALVVPSTDATWYAGSAGNGMFRSTDAGATWSAASSGLGSMDVRGAAVSGDGTVYAATAGGLFSSRDGGTTWVSENAGLLNTQLWDVAVGPGGEVLVGTGRGAWADTRDRVPPVTSADAAPVAPDGQAGWYVTAPSVTLTVDETATVHYQWDGTGGPWSVYADPLAASEGTSTLWWRSVDSAGNTETARSRVFKVDTQAPTDPALASSSHTTGTPSNDPTVDVSLSGASDGASGVSGFSVAWSQDAPSMPDTSAEVAGDATSFESAALADGTWWLALRTRDAAGNWTSTAALGPFLIDQTAPGRPTGLAAYAGNGRADLAWTNPAADFASVRVLRSTSGYATSPSPGGSQTQVLEGTAAALVQTGLPNGVRHYFTLFARDAAGNWSAPATTSVLPAAKAALGRPIASPSSPLVGRYFTVYGTISPRHVGATSVRLYFYRYSSGAYRLQGYATAKVAAKASSYSLRYRARYRGTWMVKARHLDSNHVVSYSSPRYFKVR